MDTIFALASAGGKAGVAVIRVSGPQARTICTSMGAILGSHDRKLVKLRSADGALIDQAFALSFAEGHSFTGEQVVELHTHGSPAVVSAVLLRLSELGARQAEAGEFTRRALENGCLDLAQVEGLADLIDAETEGQRKQAVEVFEGALGSLVDGWRSKLLRASALLEATIDFVDEDVPVDVYPEVGELVSDVYEQVNQEASGVSVRERIRDGFEVALVGAPNAGKSTLLNRLAGRDAAITSEIAGTTRDVIEVKMDVGGLPVTFLDTAGLRVSSDTLESIGISKGRARAARADIRVHLLDSLDEAEDFGTDGLDIYLQAKSDLKKPVSGMASLSGYTGEGVSELLSRISEHLEGRVSSAGIATRTRHHGALVLAASRLKSVSESLRVKDLPVDILAEDLRSAVRALDSLVGRIDVESVLGEIFSSFCIGK